MESCGLGGAVVPAMLVALGVALAGCPLAVDAPDACLDEDPDTQCDDEDTDAPGDPDESRRANGDCAISPQVGIGGYEGTLFGAEDEAGGACFMGGPDAFVRFAASVKADVRAEVVAQGFTPRVELRGNACPGGQTLACGLDGDAAVAEGVPAGAEVLVVVGVDPDAPALDGATRERLSFQVFVSIVPVLAEGAVCEPPELGRCDDGMACLADAVDPQAPARCRPVFGDLCGGELPTIYIADTMSGPFSASIPVDPLLADNHAHACGGAGEIDLVVELELAPGLAVDDTLVIEAQDVGLALRSPWCDPGAEVACEPSTTGAVQVELPQVGTRSLAGERPLLFVEWPAGADLPDTLDIDLSLITP